jgi:hypothetical protein
VDKFLFKTCIFLFIWTFSICTFSYLIRNNNNNNNVESAQTLKIKNFKQFIKEHNKINIVIGSSLSRQSINPKVLGNNWFTFSNPSQNIYQSYKFLEYFSDSIMIDTILVVVSPFDFSNQNPLISGLKELNYMFKEDTILVDNYYNLLKLNAQEKLEYFFLDYEKMVSLLKKRDQTATQPVISNQGHRIVDWEPDNLDKRFNHNLDDIKSSFPLHFYYSSVDTNLNVFFYDIFINYIKKNTKYSIFVLSPKSKYYTYNQEKFYGKQKLNIKNYFKKQNLPFMDFEEVFKTKGKHFRDNVHLSSLGIKKFSIILKDRLRQTK